jgi:hypothetical protein
MGDYVLVFYRLKPSRNVGRAGENPRQAKCSHDRKRTRLFLEVGFVNAPLASNSCSFQANSRQNSLNLPLHVSRPRCVVTAVANSETRIPFGFRSLGFVASSVNMGGHQLGYRRCKIRVG